MTVRDVPGRPPHWIEVDLDRLESNARRAVELARGRKLLAVVKANAYGHGALPAARAFLRGGAAGFAVFLVEEGRELRAGGMQEPILLMGPLPIARLADVLDAGLIPTVHSAEAADALEAEGRRRGAPIGYHLKLDTGMGRIGIPAKDLGPFLERLSGLTNLRMEGLFSQMACADEPDHPLNPRQRRSFLAAVEATRAAGHRPGLVHLSNSAALLSGPDEASDAVRPGLILYGYSPAPAALPADGFSPALSFRARVAQVKQVPAGATAGYGAVWSAPRPTAIATLPVGYQEGLRRGLEGASVVIHGRRVPIVGRISMDLATLDVGDGPPVRTGDIATLLGVDGAETVDAWEWATRSATHVWDVLCALSPAVPRVYLRAGAFVPESDR